MVSMTLRLRVLQNLELISFSQYFNQPLYEGEQLFCYTHLAKLKNIAKYSQSE